MAKKVKKKKTAGDYILGVILLVAIGVFLFAAYNLITIFMAYKQGNDEYKQIEEDVISELPAADTGDEKVPPPFEVDWAELKAKNEDTVGWLYVEGVNNINYPIAHGTDNEYYLHHTLEKTYNFAGTVFVDYENKGDFSDCNTIVYGHNMKNGSMFGLLKHVVSDGGFQTSSFFWILTPEHNYRYQIISAYTTSKDSDTYTLFSAPGIAYGEWLPKMRANSEIDTGDLELTQSSRIVTLSTCTGNSSTRFVVQGVLIQD